MTADGQNVRRRAGRVVAWAGLGLVALVAAATAWLWIVDLGFVKPRVERLLTELSGRGFEIQGGLSIDVDREIVAVARDVRWENAAWSDAGDMLSVEYAEVRVNLWSLFVGPIVLEYVAIENADVHLAVNAEDEFNWDVFASAEDGDTRDAGDKDIGILLRQLDVDGLNVVYTSPARERPVRLLVDELDQLHRDDDQLDIELAGTLGDRVIRVDGEVGSWSAIQSGRDIHFDLEGELGSLAWSGDGYLDDIAAPRRPAFNVEARGASLDELARMLGLGEDRKGDIDISASLAPADDGPLTLDVQARFGETEVEARGTFSDLANVEQMDIELLAAGPNLGRVLRFFGIDQVQDAPFRIDVNARRAGAEVAVEQARMEFGDSEFALTARLPRFPSLDDGDAKLSISGPDMAHFRRLTGLPGAATGPFSLDLDLGVRADGMEIVKLDVETGLGQLHASGELAASDPRLAGTTIDVDVDIANLAAIGEAYEFGPLPAYPGRFRGRIMVEADAIRVLGPATLTAGGVHIDVDGRWPYANGITGTTARVRVQGPDLRSAVAAFADIDGLPARAFDVNGRIRVDDAALGIDSLGGTLGTATLSADGRLTFVPGLAGSRLRFSIEGPAIEELTADVGGYSLVPGRFALAGRASLERDRVAIEDLELRRERGELKLDFELGLPVARRWANFDVAASGADVRALLAGVSGFEADEAAFTLKARGEMREQELRIQRFNVTVGEAGASAEGTLGLAEDTGRTRLAVSGRIPSLASIGSLRGRRFSDQGVAWSFDASGQSGRFEIADLELELGDSDVRGSLTWIPGKVPDLRATLASDALTMKPLFEPDESPVDIEPAAQRDDGRLIPDYRLPLEALRTINGRLDVRIGRLQRGALRLERIELDASLDDGVLDIRKLSFDPAAGQVAARLRLMPAEGGAVTDFEFVGRNAAFGLSRTNQDLARTADVDAKLRLTGDDLRSMAGSADGILLVDMRGGAIGRNAFLQALYGDVLEQILSVINPFYQPNTATVLDCFVAPISLDNGRLSATPLLVVRTDKLNMMVRPAVNLKTERLDVSVRTMPRKGISISTAELFNPYVKIVGTLGAPLLAVDEQGVLVTGGAAVATGGLSILAKAAWDRLTRSGKLCDETRDEAAELFADRLPGLELPPRPVAGEAGE